MEQIYKYPRTHHIEGSRLQPGDEDLTSVPFKSLVGKYLVVEEKMDGSNCAVSFSENGNLLLQSRGHYLTGGKREKHFGLFKTWASTHTDSLKDLLGTRYIMYGEWLYAKHTVYYDRLPHYFLEFDILDLQMGCFLSTEKRISMLKDYPFIKSVKVLSKGYVKSLETLTGLIGPSGFISNDFRENLVSACDDTGQNPEKVLFETDTSSLMEGLYIKSEDHETVVDRYKFVRAGFLTTVINSNSHWLNRPIIRNRLSDDSGFWG